MNSHDHTTRHTTRRTVGEQEDQQATNSNNNNTHTRTYIASHTTYLQCPSPPTLIPAHLARSVLPSRGPPSPQFHQSTVHHAVHVPALVGGSGEASETLNQVRGKENKVAAEVFQWVCGRCGGALRVTISSTFAEWEEGGRCTRLHHFQHIAEITPPSLNFTTSSTWRISHAPRQ